MSDDNKQKTEKTAEQSGQVDAIVRRLDMIDIKKWIRFIKYQCPHCECENDIPDVKCPNCGAYLDNSSWTIESALADISLCVEFGYKLCEKGENLQVALKTARKTILDH